MTDTAQIAVEHGVILDVPLNKLKASPRNARRTPHGDAAIEALAASIAVKGVLQAPVVEPEADEGGTQTGFYLVTIGEGRRLALRLLAKRKRVKKTDPVRCVVDSLALFAFYSVHDRPTCVEIGARSVSLETMAPGITDSVAGRQVADRHESWAVRLPKAAADLWSFVSGLPGDDLLGLLAHITGLTINAVANPMDRRPGALRHADVIAETLELDMTAYWSATASSYLGRVTKAKISEAVAEGVSVEAAARIADLKKAEMVDSAEQLLAGRGWLPKTLRRAGQTFEPIVAEQEGAEVAAVSQETVAA